MLLTLLPSALFSSLCCLLQSVPSLPPHLLLSTRLRLALDYFAAYVDYPMGNGTHHFVELNGSYHFADPQMEIVDIMQVADKVGGRGVGAWMPYHMLLAIRALTPPLSPLVPPPAGSVSAWPKGSFLPGQVLGGHDL